MIVLVRALLVCFSLILAGSVVLCNDAGSENIIEFLGDFEQIYVTTDENNADLFPITGSRARFHFAPGQSSGYYLVYWKHRGQWYRKWFRVVSGHNKLKLTSFGDYGLSRIQLRDAVNRHKERGTMTVVIDGQPVEVSVSGWESKPLPKYYLILLAENDDVARSERLSPGLMDKGVALAVVSHKHWRVAGANASVGDCLLYNSIGQLIAKWKHESDDNIINEVENALSGKPQNSDPNMTWVLIIVGVILAILILRNKQSDHN